MMNELKLKLCKWRFYRYTQLRNRALSNARKHCISGNDYEFDKSMKKASIYMKKITKVVKEAEEIVEIQQLRAWFWN